MEFTLIDKKYVTKNGKKVQVMLSNAKNQIIIANKELVYLSKVLKDDTVTIHSYLKDKQRELNDIVFSNIPKSNNHVTHLFEIGKLYTKFTSSRAIEKGICLESAYYHLTFLYFIKLKNRNVLCVELMPSDFKEEVLCVTTMTKIELEDFIWNKNSKHLKIYDKIDDVNEKLILDYETGIKYVDCSNDLEMKNPIVNDYTLDLSDENMIELYNRYNRPNSFHIGPLFFDENDEYHIEKENDAHEEEKKEDWKVYDIKDVKNVQLAGDRFFYDTPIMILINDEQTTMFKYSINYEKRDEYFVQMQKRIIKVNKKQLLKKAKGKRINFAKEPNFFEFSIKEKSEN